MTPRRWQQIERLFHDALERPLEERAAFLDQSCAGDDSLRREVNALLDSPATANRFLDRDALEVAASLVSVSTRRRTIQTLPGMWNSMTCSPVTVRGESKR